MPENAFHRQRSISLMISLTLAAGNARAAEGYLLELIAYCAFRNIDEPGDRSNSVAVKA